MKRGLSYILTAAALIVSCVSCSQKVKVIPRAKMVQVYADMFLMDQELSTRGGLGRITDTTMVYEAVFEKYGYTWENFLASQDHYILDAGRYARILKKTVKLLEKQKKTLIEERDRQLRLKEVDALRRRFAPNRVLLLDTLHFNDQGRDTLLMNFDFQLGLDTAYAGPRMIVWADTVKVAVDTDSVVVTAGRRKLIPKKSLDLIMEE